MAARLRSSAPITPHQPASVELKHERVAYWRGVGAKLSPIVEKLVTKNPAPAAEPVADTVAA